MRLSFIRACSQLPRPQLIPRSRSPPCRALTHDYADVENRWKEAKATRDRLRADLQQINGSIRQIQTVCPAGPSRVSPPLPLRRH